ncbi:MAG TPA: hypothetical protein VNQ90_18690 [Chthoniobacteraceae bacterium]|nr:hypothetical protein [Chthoniobacteraceae bacterium]
MAENIDFEPGRRRGWRQAGRLSLLTLGLALPLLLTSCKTTEEKEKDQIAAPTGSLRDQSGDVSFQGFVSRLRKAASKRDVEMMANMMTPDFGYSWEPGGEGPGVFRYWDKNNLWPELNLILRESFVLSGDFMVAPPQVATDPDYHGYRAGLRMVNGSWRFAYFVSAPPDQADP